MTHDEVVCTCSRYPSTSGTSPAHQLTRERTEAEEVAEKGQGSGIAKGGAEVALDGVLGAQVDLLEQFYVFR